MSDLESRPDNSSAVWWVIGMAVASSAAALAYHGVRWAGYGHSAAMFLGVPALLAILLALTPKARTVTGGILKGVTLALLIVAPLLGEGYVCILMASPLFYAVGLAIGLIEDHRRRRTASRGTTLSCVALVLLPMCFEGVAPQLTFDRHQSVSVTRIVAASASAVEQALSRSPNLETRLPAYLRIGFPRPLAARGEGIALGDLRTIHFSGAEGDPPGDLVMRVEDSESGHVRFVTVSDASKLAQWVRWDSSDVSWKAIDGGRTVVTWTIQFERQLDPSWYFVPWERAAVRQAAAYLIEANTTPGAERP